MRRQPCRDAAHHLGQLGEAQRAPAGTFDHGWFVAAFAGALEYEFADRNLGYLNVREVAANDPLRAFFGGLCDFGDHMALCFSPDEASVVAQYAGQCQLGTRRPSPRITVRRILSSVELSEQQRAFFQKANVAGMITLRRDGSAVAVRVGVALVDGKLWSSGTRDRARTRWLRRDPRATLFLIESTGFAYMSIESRVTILEGPDAPELSVRLFRVMQKRPTGPLSWFGGEKSEEEFLQTMIDEQRLIYEFEPLRITGL
jgi:hypothetical protein